MRKHYVQIMIIATYSLSIKRVRNDIIAILNNDLGTKMPFHVTEFKNLDSIIEHGLVPKIGKNSKDCGETEERIYFFINKQELETGMLGWLGELFDDEDDAKEPLIYIEVNDSEVDFQIDSNGDVFFECTSSKTIPSSSFKAIYLENWEKIY